MGSFNGNIGVPSGGFNLLVEYSISQSIGGNYTDISATGYVKRNNSSYMPYNSSSSANLVIDGNSSGYSGSYDLRSDGYKSIVSNNSRVYHNSDGTKSTTITFSFNGLLSNWHPNGSISQTITLPTIPRQASITSAPDFNDEQNPTISYSNPAGGSVSSLQACISLTGSADDVHYRDISKYGSSYTFNLSASERTTLLQATSTSNSRTVKFYVKTGIGGNTYYSSLTRTFTVVNGNPTFSNFTYEDTNESTLLLTGNNQTVIKGYSNVKGIVSATNRATSRKSASMSKYRFVIGEQQQDINYSLDLEVYGTINGAKNNVFNMYAIDSRGNSTLKTISPNQYLNYSEPEISNCTATRNDNNIGEITELTFSGTFWNDNFGSVTNDINFTYRYRNTDTLTWTDGTTTIEATKNGNDFSFNDTIFGDLENGGFNINNSYYIELSAIDSLTTKTTTIVLSSGIPNMAMHKNGTAFGQPYDEDIGGTVQIDGYRVSGVAYCSLVTNSYQTFTDSTRKKVNFGISYNYGNFTYDRTNQRIIIPKGTKTIRVGGHTAGTGYCWVNVEVTNENNQDVAYYTSRQILVQFAGNGYWSQALPTQIIELDETKEHYVSLVANGYNGGTFGMNAGFGENATSIYAEKVM